MYINEKPYVQLLKATMSPGALSPCDMSGERLLYCNMRKLNYVTELLKENVSI